jgi:glycine/D-amino acid oxidase-like deaminating enzyme
MLFDSKHYLYYFRLTPDRRMLFGGRAAFFPESGNAVRQSAEILRQGMLQVFPQLAGIPVDYCWGGTLSFTFDMMPHAGQKDGLYYALGYSGHGVAFSTHLGRLVAEQMLDLPVDNPIAELPFPGAPLGLYNGLPWFLPFAGAWHKVLDWVT